MKRSFDGTIDSIVESYEKWGGINHLDGPNLPSRQSVVSILKDIQAVTFPGFQDEDTIDCRDMKNTIGEIAHRIAGGLTREAERSIRFRERLSGGALNESGCRDEAGETVTALLEALPSIRERLALDVQAAFNGDPAAKSTEEVILSYPGLEAISVHRIAHFLWTADIPLIPRMMSEYVHGRTGIDIHPGATIGDSFFIDHGTGVVIGETTTIGANVKIYQGVTLGAESVRKEFGNKKRHPTIEDDVTIYSGATILGGETVIGKGTMIGGNVWITSSVPPYSRVLNPPSRLILKTFEPKQKNGDGGSEEG
jgi:serine O-acetyltransferase